MKPAESEWIEAMVKLRRYCDSAGFSKRQVAMMSVRPPVERRGAVIAYPDAMFYISMADVDRAIAEAKKSR